MSDGINSSTTRWVLAAFWGVIIIGLPFWWKTTEVYRAHLPLQEIDLWRTHKSCAMTIPTTIDIILPSDMASSDDRDRLAHTLATRLQEGFNSAESCLHFPVHVNAYSGQEGTHLSAKGRSSSTGHYTVYVQPDPYAEQLGFSVSSERSARFSIPETSLPKLGDPRGLEVLQDALADVLLGIFSDEYHGLQTTACQADRVRDKNDMKNMRALKYSPGYQITFSLMNKDPSQTHVDWDIREAIQGYLAPLLHQLSMVSNFTLDSQIQHYAQLSMQPRYKERKGLPGYYYFDPEQLPHFINSAEWNLASTISSYPTLNFILYVPAPDDRLRIHDAHGKPLPGNAFLIPRWGGVVIKNPPRWNGTDVQHFRLDKADLRPIMKIFVAQLRSLLGVQDMDNLAQRMPAEYNVTFMAAPQRGITLLEKDALIRQRTVENMANAAATLSSLAQLVTEIPNMVVLDHINTQVRESLAALQQGCAALGQGQFDAALTHSIDAIELSEKAFFDPTMVSMLYFPDEHKYAIYMPLFVPISVPLVMSLVKELKAAKKKKQKTE